MNEKSISVCFYQAESGNEPVRNWLKDLDKQDRALVGADIKTVEFGWPIGMPVCGSMGKGLYEVRTDLPDKRISRVLFFVQDRQMILLHGFIKKTQKTPKQDLDLALSRKRNWELKQ